MIRSTVFAALVALALPAAAFAQLAPAPATPAPAAKAPAATPAAPAVPVAPAAAAKMTPAPIAAREKFRADCGADIAKLCADATPVKGATPDQGKAQRGKLRACLVTNKAKLSTACNVAVTEREAALTAKKK